MAGIGFELRRLSAKGGFAAPLSSAVHGATIVAGPWLLTVIAMGLLQRLIGIDTTEAFTLQSIIIYLFCISLIATAPVIAASMRLVSDALYMLRFEDVRAIYLCTVILCAASGAAAATLVFGVFFGFEIRNLIPSVFAASLASLLWPATAFASTVRAFRTITVGFICGLFVAVCATLAAPSWHAGAALEALAFASGLGLASSFVSTAILRTFAFPARDLSSVFRSILRMMVDRCSIVLGATFAAIAIWIDSLVVWGSSVGTEVPIGLTTAPSYDSALFVARLTMLPGLVLYLVSIDTDWFVAIRRFLTAINDHRTLRQIEDQLVSFRSLTSICLLRLMVIQGAATIISLFLAPLYVPLTGLGYMQMSTLRFGLLGAFFHVIFFVASALVVNCGRERSFLVLQMLFLVLNAGATALTLALPQLLLGVGYFAAATLSAIAALLMLERSLAQLTYLTFADALEDSRRIAPKPLFALWPRTVAPFAN